MKYLSVCFLAALCLSLALSSCSSGASKSDAVKKIEVTGSSEMEVLPDEIFLSVSLKEYMGPGKIKVKLDTIKAAFLAQCAAVGISDSSISISGYNGDERWSYFPFRRSKKEPEFMNSISYTLKVHGVEKLDKLVAKLNEQSIENYGIVKTQRSDITELRKEVKKQALIAAKAKAEYLAHSVGEEVADALSIREVEGEGSDYSALARSVGKFSNSIRQDEISLDRAPAPNFEKIKIRFEMKCEFRMK